MRPLAVCLILLASACARHLDDQDPCGFRMSAGRRVSWSKQSLPIVLHRHENMPPEAQPALARAVSRWNQAVGYQLVVVAQDPVGGQAKPARDGYNTVVFDYSSYEVGWLRHAFARVSASGARLYEGDVSLNVLEHAFAVDTPTPMSLDLESVLIHEIGHVIGLDHQKIEASVMYPYLSYGEVRRSLAGVDIQNILCEY